MTRIRTQSGSRGQAFSHRRRGSSFVFIDPISKGSGWQLKTSFWRQSVYQHGWLWLSWVLFLILAQLKGDARNGKKSTCLLIFLLLGQSWGQSRISADDVTADNCALPCRFVASAGGTQAPGEEVEGRGISIRLSEPRGSSLNFLAEGRPSLNSKKEDS